MHTSRKARNAPLIGRILLGGVVVLAVSASVSSASDTPQPTHGIGSAVVSVDARGGQAVAPDLTLIKLTPTRPVVTHRVVWTAAGGYDDLPIPRAPKGCHVTHGKLTPAAKRSGVTEMVTWWCPESANLGRFES
jgi:hypothetical protein